MTKKALISGVTGQDGSILTEKLLASGWYVVGHSRRNGFPHHKTSSHLEFVSFPIDDDRSWVECLDYHNPDLIFHFASMSYVPDCLERPCDAVDKNIRSTVACLDAIKKLGLSCKAFFASSSEIFGTPTSVSANEETPIRPDSFYGMTKAASHFAVESYRNRFGIFAVNGVFFNHESTRRPETFVTKKIAKAAAAISLGIQRELTLGNLNVWRDWGYAPEYVDCAFESLQMTNPEDFVIGSGTLTKLEHLVKIAFETVNLDWQNHVSFDESLMRGNADHRYAADARKAKSLLGWEAKTSIDEVIVEMVEASVIELKQMVGRKAA